jgi:nicotinate-nucleotide pyrophosphorylase (carboxylating)
MDNFDALFDKLVTDALSEDIGSGDHSTLCCIPAGEWGKAVLKIKEDGVLAGMEAAERIFKKVQPDARFTAFKKDGDFMKAGEQAFEVEASVHTILQCERLVLNCMQRMSGIAGLTRQYTDQLKGYHTRILDTRKTTPNFRLFEKWAVAIGGGVNHRYALYDMIMLKDNHIDYCGGITKAVEKAWDYVQTQQPGLKIEVETRSIADVEELIDYAKTGVDFVSVGALIHQARSVDLSLKAVKS